MYIHIYLFVHPYLYIADLHMLFHFGKNADGDQKTMRRNIPWIFFWTGLIQERWGTWTLLLLAVTFLVLAWNWTISFLQDWSCKLSHDVCDSCSLRCLWRGTSTRGFSTTSWTEQQIEEKPGASWRLHDAIGYSSICCFVQEGDLDAISPD